MIFHYTQRINGSLACFGNTAGHILKGFGLLYLVLAISGCTILKEKFQLKTLVNVGIFADTTLSMLSQVDLGFDKDEAIYTREFFDPAGEEEQRLLNSKKATRKFIRGIIKYSLEMVVIAETHETAADKIKAYADYISDFDDTILKKLGLERDHYTETIEEVRAQNEFMDALKKAQPIIHGASRFMNTVLDEKFEAIEDLTLKLDKKIDERFSEVILYQRALEKEKYIVLKSLGRLYLTFKGDKDAFDRLVKSGAILKKGLIPQGHPSDDDLLMIKEHLMSRLEGLHLIGTEIKPDWDNYRATHQELDKLHRQAVDRVNKMRLVTLVWVRAHQKMAAGIESPAEWFNINDLPSTMFQMGTEIIF
ncbi:MAG: hypothetical protein HRT97_05700 [Moritella sp.]|uniref:hypothetical protein n=1 Tax=Moritella sp. TaxID=78556 RepID=UPI0025CC23E3|nr:hypothetical protein [Moritella sp.]NQZ91824.1 hypothetical protein [Moritella sp.]